MMIGQYDIYSLMLAAAVISFLGFALENIWLALRKGYMDNRNMTLPFLLGYGLLVTGIYAVIGTPEELHIIIPPKMSLRSQYIIYFLMSAVIVSIGEILLGKTVEHIFGFEYWNYESLPLHITKYTSVPTSLGFAMIITIFMGRCFPRLMEFIVSFDADTVQTAALILGTAMTADFICSFAKMYKTRSLNVRYTIYLSDIKDTLRKAKYALKG